MATTALDRYARLEAPARYYDGSSATAREVVVSFGARSLVIMSYDGVAVDHWSLGSLRAVGAKGQMPMQLVPEAASDARLLIAEEEMVDAIEAVCPGLYKRPATRKGVGKGIVLGLAAFASVIALVVWIIPALAGQLAFMIPPKQEQKLGDAVVGQIQDLLALGGDAVPGLCEAPEGAAALAKMQARLDAGAELPYPIRVDVIDHGLVNAVAVPGGRVLLFRGLIEKAANPEEVTGVLAHEIGHVVHRDPTVGALRVAGSAGILGLLVGDVFGATLTIAVAETLMDASYKRDVEARADETAVRLLAEAGLPSTPFAGFFRRIAEEYGEPRGVFRYLSSHPQLASRAEEAEAADTVGEAPYTPVMSDQDWVALREICSETETLPDRPSLIDQVLGRGASGAPTDAEEGAQAPEDASDEAPANP